MKKVLSILLLTILIGALCGCIAQPIYKREPYLSKISPQVVGKSKMLEAGDIANLIFPSTVMITMNDINSCPLSIGSGFVVGKELIVTNHHVIIGASSGYVQFMDSEKHYEIGGVLALDSYYDLVLLQVPGVDAPAVKLSGQNSGVGDKIYAIGSPMGLKGTLSDGLVSGIRAFEGDSIIQITAPISPGSSGGPIVNGQGELVGVAVAALSEGQNINFAIQVGRVGQLLHSARDLMKLATVKKTKPSLLEKLDSKKSMDGVIVDSFFWNSNSMRDSEFSYSIRNYLDVGVCDVSLLIIFYDEKGDVIDYYYKRNIDWGKTLGCPDISPSPAEIIPAGLAKRFQGLVDKSTKKMTTKEYADKPYTKLEIRILNFDIMR